MKSSFNTRYHPNQEDKSGNPNYASGTGLNYSTNDSRSEGTNISTQKSNFLNRLLRIVGKPWKIRTIKTKASK